MTPKRKKALEWCYAVFNLGTYPGEVEGEGPTNEMFSRMIQDGQLIHHRRDFKVGRLGLIALGLEAEE